MLSLAVPFVLWREKAMKEALNAPSRRSFTTWVFRITIFLALLGLMGSLADRSNAEQPRTSSCTEKLQGFVVLIDELLTKNVLQDEPFWEVIREYLPAKGCTVEEVIAISRTSKFYAPLFEQGGFYTISFRNSDTEITFGLRKDTGNKDTGNIEYPSIGSTHLPSW
jgi:hypothetical protein